jgi:hypothetical protein
MTLYQRSKVWWYEFEFRGHRIRGSLSGPKQCIGSQQLKLAIVHQMTPTGSEYPL